MTLDQHVEFEPHPPSLGCRLRDARESGGRTIEEIAAALRVPVALVEAVERGDHARLGAPVYVRGHLLAYAKLVGVPSQEVDRTLSGHTVAPPQLIALAPSTRLQRFADRAARRAVYVVLTSAIVLPVVWYATQPGLRDARVALNPLDVPTSSASAAADISTPPASADRPSKPAKEYPIVASLAPFYAKQNPPLAEQATNGADTTSAAAGDQWLTLHLVASSWVEVYDQEGRKIEQALLPAGAERHYTAGQVGRVTLGNADAVVVRKAGRDIDVSAFKRANVARFAISSDGSLQPVGG